MEAPVYTPAEWSQVSKLISEAAEAQEVFEVDDLERYAAELQEAVQRS